jgi:serine protease
MKGLRAASIALALSVSTASANAAAIGTVSPAKFNVSSLRAEGTYNRFIVHYRDGSTEQKNRAAAVQSAGAAMARAGLSQAALATRRPAVSYSRKLATGSELVTVSRKLSQAEATAFIQSLASDPAVAYVTPDVLRRAVDSIPAPAALAPASFVPNDTSFNEYQTNYLPSYGTATPMNRVRNYGGANITGGWDLSDGSGTTIAVLDTGIVKHADVNTSLADAGYDFITDAYVSGRTTNGRVPGGWDTGDWTSTEPWRSDKGCVNDENPPSNSSWHGTHVASLAGAQITNNGIGMAGVAYNAKVVPVRVLGHCGGYDSDIVDAIVWAAGGHVDGVPDNPNPAQVINLSLSGEGTCPSNHPTALAIAKANALGAAVVVAAGNADMGMAKSMPGNCPGAIAVAAVGVTSRRAYYSSYNGPGESIVALAAFGGGVFLNDASGGLQLNPEGFAWQAGNSGTTTPVASPGGDNYARMAGTSQAAPHVAGTVALMQSARIAAGLSLLTPVELKSMLQSTARVPNVSPDPAKTFGAGILDAGAAVAAAAGNGVIKDNAIPLSNGVMLRGRHGRAGSIALYKLDVPAGARALNLRTLGGTGDVSIYVKAGSPGSATDYDYKSVQVGSNSESVAIGRPVATTYYLTVVGESSFYSGLNVVGFYSAPK